ncbi:tagaturonate reductase [Vibrio viridaestus]|uniref:Tagaturonate reductase n=1 Tax=Vibrio viridaestus TaxID=2487322 RepID=A0A3N9U5L0_9VIBR|nr:tagaturonate reductase [Vibrio viridaestus]RQW64992.1 tagaturonate reductase [Vibrio viridaestus]
MKQLNRTDFSYPTYPEKIIQFGEGNFLRAFLDWQIDQLNEHTTLNSGVVVVRPIDSNFPPSLDTQNGLYTTFIRGINGKGEAVAESRIISSVSREISAVKDFDKLLDLARNEDIEIIFSNTTEAGIAYVDSDKLADMPPSSYPAKLTKMLFERFQAFNGDSSKGWIIVPCELIDYNGEALKAIVHKYVELWSLPSEFAIWIDEANTFCSTLVDRIVTGYPRDESEQLQQQIGYNDTFMVCAEHFYLFVIQGPESLYQKLCLDQLNIDNALNILIVDDIKPYKERKVAILNGAHTALVPVSFLSGIDTVGESMADEQMESYLKGLIFDEIIPTLSLPKDELEGFANDVLNRFRNPYIQHQLLSISLNSMTKFKTRNLPQLLAYQEKNGVLPKYLTFALAALIAFYQGKREQGSFDLADDQHWLDFYAEKWPQVEAGQIQITDLVSEILANKAHWDHDLTKVVGLVETVSSYVAKIRRDGVRNALAALL